MLVMQIAGKGKIQEKIKKTKEAISLVFFMQWTGNRPEGRFFIDILCILLDCLPREVLGVDKVAIPE